MSSAAESYPQRSEDLLRVVQARDAGVSMAKLVIEKLEVQLARRNRVDFGSTSARFEKLQGRLLETHPLDELRVRLAAAKPAANAPHIGGCRREFFN